MVLLPNGLRTKGIMCERCGNFRPDLILADYDLPQYTGSLALVAAKKLRPEVPFVLVTGALAEYDDLTSEILVNGARECVFKDHLERLAPAVRKALGVNGGNGNDAGKRAS